MQGGKLGPTWPLIAITGFWTLNIFYRAVTWRRSTRKIIDQINWGKATFIDTNPPPTWYQNWSQFRAMCAASLDLNALSVAVALGSVLIAAVPVFIIGARCY